MFSVKIWTESAKVTIAPSVASIGTKSSAPPTISMNPANIS